MYISNFENKNNNFFLQKGFGLIPLKAFLLTFEGIFTDNFLSALLTLSIPDLKTKSRSDF